jgi:hypothetical protein
VTRIGATAAGARKAASHCQEEAMPAPETATDTDRPTPPRPPRPLGDRIGDLIGAWLPKPRPGPQPVPQPVAVPAAPSPGRARPR